MTHTAPLLVVMGVSGSGKSTVGAALAQRLGVPFADADDFHPPANIAKMTAGQPLDDDDRHPWLEAIGVWLVERDAAGGVISCSALKRVYRDQLRSHVARTRFVHLHGTRGGDRAAAVQPSGSLHAVVAARLAVRDARAARGRRGRRRHRRRPERRRHRRRRRAYVDHGHPSAAN